jgi:hypothetical protein
VRPVHAGVFRRQSVKGLEKNPELCPNNDPS